MKVKLNDRVLEFPPALHRVPPARRHPRADCLLASTAASRHRSCGARCNAAHAAPPQLFLVVWAVVDCRAAWNWATLGFTNKKKKIPVNGPSFGGSYRLDCLGQANVKLLLLTYLWAYPNVYVVSKFMYGVSRRGIKKGLDKKIPACPCYNKVGRLFKRTLCNWQFMYDVYSTSLVLTKA